MYLHMYIGIYVDVASYKRDQAIGNVLFRSLSLSFAHLLALDISLSFNTPGRVRKMQKDSVSSSSRLPQVYTRLQGVGMPCRMG